MILVEIILKKPNGEVLATISGSAHESLRWPAHGAEPLVDDEEGLKLFRIFYDADSRPLDQQEPLRLRLTTDRRKDRTGT